MTCLCTILFTNQNFPPFFLCETGWREERESLIYKKFVQKQVRVSKYFQLKWPFKDFCKSTDRVNIMNPNSKVPNNTEVTRFSTALFYLIQTIKECISPVNSATFYNFKAKICQLWTPQSTFDNVDFCQIWAKWPKKTRFLGI